MFLGLGVGFVFKSLVGFLHLWSEKIYLKMPVLKKAWLGMEPTPALLGVGFILGPRIAGIMAAKKTADLVPLCHPLNLTKVEVDLKTESSPPAVYCNCRVETRGKTGVEIEALTAVQISLLTVYDMCKAVDRGMTMQDIRLMRKAGGKAGEWRR